MRAVASTRTAGNRSEHLFARDRGSEENDTGMGPFSTSMSFLQRKASFAFGGGCPTCQSNAGNLKVSQPNDAAEIEADRMADQVMSMSVTDPKPQTNLSNASNKIHRKCDACEEEDKITIQRKPLTAASAATSDSPDHVRNAISAGGRPLDLQTRDFFEPRLGYDLSLIRTHTDSTAAHSAKAIDAKAYTLGNDIVFGQGEYRPDTQVGKLLLAHELAHTIQSEGNFKGANSQIR